MYARSRYTNKFIEALLDTGHIIAVNNGYTHQTFKKFSEIADIIDTAGEVVITVINNQTGYSEGNVMISLHREASEQVANYKGALLEIILIKLDSKFNIRNPFSSDLEEYVRS